MAAASDKSKRYDRGIRVWGAHGQEALEAARVCLLNAGPTGTEALKNLVLGGIHSFTVVDGAKVTPADLGNNFLLTADGLAASRAQVATGEARLGQGQRLGPSVPGITASGHMARFSPPQHGCVHGGARKALGCRRGAAEAPVAQRSLRLRQAVGMWADLALVPSMPAGPLCCASLLQLCLDVACGGLPLIPLQCT